MKIICALCGEKTDQDKIKGHCVPRSLFTRNDRSNLPWVYTHRHCDNSFSEDEAKFRDLIVNCNPQSYAQKYLEEHSGAIKSSMTTKRVIDYFYHGVLRVDELNRSRIRPWLEKSVIKSVGKCCRMLHVYNGNDKYVREDVQVEFCPYMLPLQMNAEDYEIRRVKDVLQYYKVRNSEIHAYLLCFYPDQNISGCPPRNSINFVVRF